MSNDLANDIRLSCFCSNYDHVERQQTASINLANEAESAWALSGIFESLGVRAKAKTWQEEVSPIVRVLSPEFWGRHSGFMLGRTRVHFLKVSRYKKSKNLL